MRNRTPEWARAAEHARRELGAWIEDAIRRHERIRYHGIHDEGSFTFSWDAYWMLTRKRRVVRFLMKLRDEFAAWGNDNLYHGYYPEGEVHHGTEPFTHFVARFRTLDPGDRVYAGLLDDAAHHLGNWVAAVPAWYDWNAHAMRSWRIGTRKVSTAPPDDYEEPDSVRPAMIGLAAYAATGDERYLAFCLDYADKWAEALLEIPLPLVRFVRSPESAYADRLSEQANGTLLDRLELVVASVMVDFLSDLYALTGKPLYRDGLARVMEGLVEVVADPRNSVAAAHLAKYRRITGDTSFDRAILDRLGAPPQYNRDGLTIFDGRDEAALRRKTGMIFNLRIGHRFDQVRWGRDGTENTEPTGAAWALAWQITGSERYAARALFLAGERIRIGRGSLEDGRDHGCAGNTLGAVASGHGRADRFGHVNSVFGPLLLGSIRRYSAEEPLVVYPEGLPERVASLVSSAGEPTVTWHNSGARAATIRWLDASAPEPRRERKITVPAGATRHARLGGGVPCVR